jgi:cytochrome c553
MKTVLLEISPAAVLKAALSFLSLALVANLATAEKDYDHQLGVQLFQLCSACHGPEGHGKRELLAPSIAGLPEWYLQNQLTNFKTGKRGAHPLDISGLRMRPMARSLWKENDLHVIARYVAELPPKPPVDVLTGGDPVRGEKLYKTAGGGCATCHGEISEQTKKGPPQDYLQDWYMLEQLKKFKYGVRGGAYPKDNKGSPRDVDGQQMKAVMLQIPNEQAMKDVIAYIRQEAKKGTLGKKPTQEAATKTTTPTKTNE